MNGFVTGRTESLPADSSGIVNMSSPSGSSDSSSSAKVQTRPPPPPYKGIPSLGKPAAMHANSLQESRPTTNADIFLSQFQAQMSQMKSAMDAVQNEILLHSSRGGGRGGGGGGGSRRGRPKLPGNLPASVRYQSQISTSNGLKLKIKKSPKPNRKKGGRGKKGRGKRKKDDEDDEEDLSDGDVAHVNSTKKSGGEMQLMNHDESAVLGPPSGWGHSLPEDILFKIFSYAVKAEDGCIPLLVRLSKVSRLWWRTASRPELWTSVDLSSSRVKDKFKIERNLVYFLEHRFSHAKHLNLGN